MADITSHDPGTLGKRVRLAREARQLTQEQLGQLAGISQKAVAKIELDKQGPPKRKTLMGLAKALQVPPSWIEYGSDRFEANETIYESARLLSDLPPEIQRSILEQIRLLHSSSHRKNPRDDNL